MNKYLSMLLLSGLAIFSLGTTAYAEVKLLYKPPKMGMPETRIGSGTRGMTSKPIQLQVFAPKHTGLSSQNQPNLYWQLDSGEHYQVEVTLIKEGVEQPLLEKQFPAAKSQGLQMLSLKEQGIKLEPGVEYRWSVALITDKEQRSADQIASGTVRYEPVTGMLTIEQQAENGYWYDIINQLVSTKSPILNEFLQQEGLTIGGF